MRDASYIHVGSLKIHRAWLMLVGCCFLQGGTVSIVLGCCGLFFVPICDDLGFARSEIASYQSFYWLALVVSMPLAGRVLSKYNIRMVTCVSSIAVALAAGLMGTYTAVWQWILSGLVFGTFGCLVFHLPLVTMVNNWFADRVGMAMGIATAVSAIAIMVFSPLIQGVITVWGWRTAYFVEAIIILVLTVPWCAFVFVRQPSDIGAQPYRRTLSPAHPSSGGESDSDRSGVLCKNALRSVSFAAVFIFAGIAAFIGSGFDSNIPGYIDSIGFSASFAAIVVSAISFGSFCEKLLMGFINDKFGVWRAVACEIVLVCLGIAGLVFLRDPVLILIAAALFGVQDSFTSISLPLIVRKLFGNREYTQIYAWARVGAGLFGMFAAVSVAFSYDAFGSYVPAFAGAVGLCGLAAVVLAVASRYSERLPWTVSEAGNPAFSEKDTNRRP